ncbi:MAG TPA: hypothetical protein VGT01_05880 [Candidatus Dormibacteraeota bacterium]|nr:hypothetical protein [Candidatus Dormibacteraeota bacterium]
MDQDESLGQRGRRAVPLIAAALAVIVVASLLYLRATAPQPRTILQGALPVPQLSSRYRVDYDFISPTLGWAAVMQYSGIQRFWVFHTTDGATHWNQMSTGSAVQGAPLSIRFFDPKRGFLYMDRLYRTSDGGARWNVISLPDDTPFFTFATANQGWARDGPQIYSTIDGGLTWQTRGVMPPSPAVGGAGLGSLEFRAGGEGWIGTYDAERPTVQATLDGGATWRSIELPLPPSVTAPISGKPLFFTTSVRLIPTAGVLSWVSDDFGNAQAYTSMDHGGSWQAIKLPGLALGQADISNISFLDSRHWWASHFAVLYKTDDAGRTWVEVNGVIPATIVEWAFGMDHPLDAKHAWSVISYATGSNHGTGLVMTSDGGSSWVAVNVPQPG